MGEFHIALCGDSGAESMPIPAASEACASTATLVPPAVTTDAAESFTLLKRLTSFPVMLGTFLVGRVFYEGRAFFVDPDLWWHAKNGQNILATHQWPTTDPYSFSVAGTPWLSYEWLGDVLLGMVARIFGLQGLDALLIVLGSVIMVALYVYGTLRSGNSKAGFVASGLLCSLAFASFNLRPQMLGYLFLVLTLIALELFCQGKQRALWFLPPLFVAWINTHGSWVIGLGVITVFLASGLTKFRIGGIEAHRWSPAQRLRLELVFLLCLAAIPCTPYGTRLAAYPFTVASSLPLNVGNVMEWQPMPFNILGGKLFLGIVIAFFLTQVVFRPIWRAAELALFFFGTIMACLHVRFLLLFVPFFAPLFATLLARWLPPYDRKKDHCVLNAALMTIVIVAMAWYFPSRRNLERAVSGSYPVRAVQYLRQHPVPGPMYNTYGYGGYLIWALPERKVFIDGRGDLYEDGGVFSEYLEVSDLKPGAFAVFRAHGIQSCLLERREPLATVLGNHPDWRQEYSDDVSVLFVKRNATMSAAAMRESATVGQKE